MTSTLTSLADGLMLRTAQLTVPAARRQHTTLLIELRFLVAPVMPPRRRRDVSVAATAAVLKQPRATALFAGDVTTAIAATPDVASLQTQPVFGIWVFYAGRVTKGVNTTFVINVL